MTNKEPTLEQQYEQTITAHRDYLLHLQNAFNTHCDDIAKKTAAQLKNVPENDKETRKKIYDDQKRELDKGLAELKKEISDSSTKLRKKLEDINLHRENREIKELEDMIQHLEETPTESKKK